MHFLILIYSIELMYQNKGGEDFLMYTKWLIVLLMLNIKPEYLFAISVLRIWVIKHDLNSTFLTWSTSNVKKGFNTAENQVHSRHVTRLPWYDSYSLFQQIRKIINMHNRASYVNSMVRFRQTLTRVNKKNSPSLLTHTIPTRSELPIKTNSDEKLLRW